MCELFGYFGQERSIVSELTEFYSHSPHHPQGWGLACSSHTHLNVEKEPLCAANSAYLQSRLASGVAASVALGHIRLATAGSTSYNNCHPFSKPDATGRVWTLVHNGTILDFAALEAFRDAQTGSTDSERVLLYIVSKIDQAAQAKGANLDAAERFKVVDQAVASLSANNNKVNILLYDGDQFYAHCNFANSLHIRREADGIFFSTRALHQGAWSQLPLNTLVAYSHDKIVRFGRKHQNQSFQTVETVQAWQRENGDGAQIVSSIA